MKLHHYVPFSFNKIKYFSHPLARKLSQFFPKNYLCSHVQTESAKIQDCNVFKLTVFSLSTGGKFSHDGRKTYLSEIITSDITNYNIIKN